MKKNTASVFARKHTLYRINRDGDFPRHTIESRRKLNQLVTDREIACGLLAHRKHNLTILYVFLRHARIHVYLYVQVGRKTGIRAPFVDSADQVRLGGEFRHRAGKHFTNDLITLSRTGFALLAMTICRAQRL